MFSGGTVVVAVSNLDAATRFYTEQLGLPLTHRFGNRWVTVEASPSYWSADDSGAGLRLGLRPHTPEVPAPGTPGAVAFGLETCDPLAPLIARLAARGVRFTGDIITFEAGACIALTDVEQNATYLWEIADETLPEGDRQRNDGSAVPAASSISGGHAIVYVENMDRAVHFYAEVLGLPLTFRHEDKIAFLEAGRRLVIALHPTSATQPAPGTRGAMRLALQVDEPVERALSRLAARGVRAADGASGAREKGTLLIEDMDGNPIELVEDGTLTDREGDEAAAAVRR